MIRNKNNLLRIIALIFGMCVFQTPVKAQVPVIPTPEADAPAAAAETTGSAEDTAAQAGKETEKGAKKFFNKMKGLYEEGSAWTGAQLESIKAIKENVDSIQSSVNSGISSGQSMYSDVDSTKNSLTSQAKDSQVGQLATLKKEVDGLNKQREERKTALIEEAKGKSKTAAENFGNLQAMLESAADEQQRAMINKQIEKARAENEKYTKAMSDIEADPDSYFGKDRQYADLTRKYDKAKSELDEMSKDSLKQGVAFGLGVLKNLFLSSQQRRDAYEKVRKDNFLKVNEVEKPENNKRVTNFRKKTLLKDIAHATSVGINYKQKSEEWVEKINRTQRNMAAADHQQTSVNMLIQQKIVDAEILFSFTEMLIADLRVRTAADMRGMPLKLKDYEQDPSILRMDNYVFTEKKIKSDKGIKNTLNKLLTDKNIEKAAKVVGGLL